jgi:hypothetical protein
MDISKALNTWITHLTSNLLTKNNKRYDKSSINGLSTGKSTKSACQHLVAHVNEGVAMSPENVDDIMIKAFSQMDATKLDQICFLFLQKCIRDNHIINNDMNEVQLEVLTEIRDTALQMFQGVVTTASPIVIYKSSQLTPTVAPKTDLLDKQSMEEFQKTLIDNITLAVSSKLESRLGKFDNEILHLNSKFANILKPPSASLLPLDQLTSTRTYIQMLSSSPIERQ